MGGGQIVFVIPGAAVLALVVWAMRVGWYPSHGERISRTARPVAFWSVMAAGTLAGLLFMGLGLFAR